MSQLADLDRCASCSWITGTIFTSFALTAPCHRHLDSSNHGKEKICLDLAVVGEIERLEEPPHVPGSGVWAISTRGSVACHSRRRFHPLNVFQGPICSFLDLYIPDLSYPTSLFQILRLEFEAKFVTGKSQEKRRFFFFFLMKWSWIISKAKEN